MQIAPYDTNHKPIMKGERILTRYQEWERQVGFVRGINPCCPVNRKGRYMEGRVIHKISPASLGVQAKRTFMVKQQHGANTN